MAARRASVRTTDLDRLGKWLDARGLTPVAADALPGGTYRFHLVVPAGTSAEPVETDEERAAWEKALA